MLRVMTDEEVAEGEKEIARLRKGGLESQIRAILMDCEIGSSGMYTESAKAKARAITRLIKKTNNHKIATNWKVHWASKKEIQERLARPLQPMTAEDIERCQNLKKRLIHMPADDMLGFLNHLEGLRQNKTAKPPTVEEKLAAMNKIFGIAPIKRWTPPTCFDCGGKMDHWRSGQSDLHWHCLKCGTHNEPAGFEKYDPCPECETEKYEREYGVKLVKVAAKKRRKKKV